MKPVSTADRVVCGWPTCDLVVCTNEGGDKVRHWLNRDQRDRVVTDLHSDHPSPLQVVALDTEGVAHAARLPGDIARAGVDDAMAPAERYRGQL